MSFRSSVLAVGGLDPSGGAGLAVDAAAIRSSGVHPALICAVTTVQNGTDFLSARPCPATEIRAGMESVLAVQRVIAFKTGALGSAAAVRAVSRVVAARRDISLVVDPVIRSSSAGRLFNDAAVAALISELFPLATLVTPNLDEAEQLCGEAVRSPSEMIHAGKCIAAMGPKAVLIKGGHLPGDRVVDVLVTHDGHVRHFESDRSDTGDVRGTGCALASLCAAHIGLGGTVEDAVQAASKALRAQIASAVHIGSGPRVLPF